MHRRRAVWVFTRADGRLTDSTTDNVTALRGGPVLARVPNDGCISYLRNLLEQAESGEVVGFVGSALHGDGKASYVIAGIIGTYALVGGIEMAKAELIARMHGAIE